MPFIEIQNHTECLQKLCPRDLVFVSGCVCLMTALDNVAPQAMYTTKQCTYTGNAEHLQHVFNQKPLQA